MEVEEEEKPVTADEIEVVQLSMTKNAIKQRQKRARAALKDGRTPGINGRPGVADKDSERIILETIMEDANLGVYHDTKWLLEMVPFFWCLF
jgi:hypothetical protein